ncbi:MAG TPA: hypothetical protein VFY71_10805 [Planctomycetota bacterium]|nr:hypothetical protein [Planctomycetota bacterium]
MLRSTLLLAVVAAPVAAQIFVPEDFPDPQSAIAAAPTGGVIVVHGGQWLPIVIDKPLTLIGDPQPLFMPDGPPPVPQPIVTLAGPGAGRVVLQNVWLGGGVDGTVYSDCAPSITGGGFDALHVFDSLIEGSPWQFAYNFTFPGADAIDVSVPLVWIERCTVRGADAAAGDNSNHQEAVDAGDAVIATGSVVLLDSTVSGGDGPTLSWDAGGAGGCPPVCPGGAGGDGIACASLVQANSTITAGAGSHWLGENGIGDCCDGPSGTALLVASHTLLGQDLTSSGPARLGQSWSLAWSTPGPAAVLFVSAGVGMAPQLGAPKLHLLPPLFLGVVLSSPGALSTTVPADAALTGLEYGVQVYSSAGWTRPIAGVLGP